ncbi:MAG TPA: hypothetical protein VJ867_17735 [Gemmatimonadaceae bacterium]|nr:hypothetical protein [Gemmatimonadaceae bacterium]
MVVAAHAGAQAPAMSGGLTFIGGSDRVRAEANVSTPDWHGIRFDFSPLHGFDRSAIGALATESSIAARLSARFRGIGVWLGTHTFGAGSAGAWAEAGRFTFSMSTQDRALRVVGRGLTYHEETVFDSVFTDTAGWHHYEMHRMVGDSTSSSQMRRWTEAQARLDWVPWLDRAIRISAMVSTSRPQWGPRDTGVVAPARVWGRVSASIPARAGFAVLASTGTEASLRDAARPSKYVMLGVRWNPFARRPKRVEGAVAAPAFAVRRAGPGSYIVTVRATRARLVEITGDFARWRPMPLREVATDVWETTLLVPAGTYRVNARIDGGVWGVPPGLTSLDDEFNGRVGLLVLR